MKSAKRNGFSQCKTDDSFCRTIEEGQKVLAERWLLTNWYKEKEKKTASGIKCDRNQ
jgi:hypothetical protein